MYYVSRSKHLKQNLVLSWTSDILHQGDRVCIWLMFKTNISFQTFINLNFQSPTIEIYYLSMGTERGVLLKSNKHEGYWKQYPNNKKVLHVLKIFL